MEHADKIIDLCDSIGPELWALNIKKVIDDNKEPVIRCNLFSRNKKGYLNDSRTRSDEGYLELEDVQELDN